MRNTITFVLIEYNKDDCPCDTWRTGTRTHHWVLFCVILYSFIPHKETIMTRQTDSEFVNDLFDKLFALVDTDMIDLHDDDTAGIDALEFEQLTIINL